MKIASTTACVVAALIPLVSTFAPGFARHRPALDLKAAGGDVPDLVKAYNKAKPEPTLPELPFPTTIVTPVVNEPVQSVSLPEIKVELPSASDMSAGIQSSVSDSIESAKKGMPSMKGTADQINSQFKGVNDFFKASQEQQVARAAAEKGSTSNVPTLGGMIEKGFTSRRAAFTESSLSVPEGKAPTLSEYLRGGFQSSTDGTSVDALAISKAKFALLMDNTYSLFGKSAPENMDMNLPEGMSPEIAAGIAVGGLGLLVIAGQNNKSSPSRTPAVKVADDEETSPLSGLTKDVVS
jgi:hypothetical protein